MLPYLLVIASLLVSTTALAQDNAWYATANIGLGDLSSSTLTYSDGSGSASARIDYDASFAGGGTIGYQFLNGLSLEGEIMYRRNEFGGADLPGLGTFNEGDFASLAIGLNAIYRFPIGSNGRWSAYAGPGYVYLQEIDIDFDIDGQQEVSFETDDAGWQFKLGGRYTPSERWFVDAGLTYFSADGIRMELPADSSQTLSSDYQHWTITLGAGWSF